MQRLKTITFVGGGNGSHVGAGYVASKGLHRVNVLTRRPDEWIKSPGVLKVRGPSQEYEGRVETITDDPADVIPHSDFVCVFAPVNAYRPIFEWLAPHVRPGTMIGAGFNQGHVITTQDKIGRAS